MSPDTNVKIKDVRSYWNSNPLCAHAIPCPLGTPEYFRFYDKLREINEPLNFSYALHEYKKFAGKKVLDVGSGNGYVLSKYAQEGAMVSGVDITEVGAWLCRKRFELLGLEGDFYVGDAEKLPFKDETFDCVCSMGVLHHIPNPEKAIVEIHRILKKNGRLIIMVYHRNSTQYMIRIRLISAITGKSMREVVNEYDGVGNPKGIVYSRAELRGLLKDFDKVEMFVDLLKGNMIFPKCTVPAIFLKPFKRKFGWFLYAKGVKSELGRQENFV